MTSNKHIHENFPRILYWMTEQVAKYIYADFRKATALLMRKENSWIPVIFFCAPGIMPGPSQGKIEIGTEISKKAPVYVTYTDLARGIIQAAGEESKWAGKEIGIAGEKTPPIDYGLMTRLFATGIMCTWTPPLWRFGHRRDWWGYK